MIILLHFSKTIGSSFKKSLKEQFGNHLLEDNSDLPINAPVLNGKMAALARCIFNGIRNFDGGDCIHGHFLPLKYLIVGYKQDKVYQLDERPH